ncbi:MAG: hypothetical protein LBL75_00375 [Rickettsiales bacterium]|jgi:hypothetical protein|nr:hypothetical protein [Rickettsiales bacterium]
MAVYTGPRIDLDTWAIKWFKAHHLLNMPHGVRTKWENQRSEKGQMREGTDFVTVTEANQALFREYQRKNFRSTYVVRVGDNVGSWKVDNNHLNLGRRISLNPYLTDGQKIGAPIKLDTDEKLNWFRNLSGNKGFALGQTIDPSKDITEVKVVAENLNQLRNLTGNQALNIGDTSVDLPGVLTENTRQAYYDATLPAQESAAMNSAKIGDRVFLQDGRGGKMKQWAMSAADTIPIDLDDESIPSMRRVLRELSQYDQGKIFADEAGNKFALTDAQIDALRPGDRINLPARWYEKLALELPNRFPPNRLGGLYDEYPPIELLSKSEQESFYRICQKALRGVKYDSELIYESWASDPSIPKPITKLIGDGRYFSFSMPKPSKALQAQVDKLLELLDSKTDAGLRDYLVNGDNSLYSSGVFADTAKRDAFISKLKDKDWLSNTETTENLKKVVNSLENYGNPSYIYYSQELSPEKKQEYQRKKDSVKDLDADMIQRDITMSEEHVDEKQLRQFISPGPMVGGRQTPPPYHTIMKNLYDVKVEDRLSGFGKKFAQYGGSDITNALTEVSGKIKYDGIAQNLKKYEAKTIYQTYKKKYDDFMDDNVKKHYQKHLGHEYSDINARGIVDALFKEKVSDKSFDPTKGPDEVLARKDAISKKMGEDNATYQSSSLKGFLFLCDCLQKIKDSGDMKNSFAGAFRNGKQNAACAKFIINEAVRTDNISEGMAALEALAVLMYDPFTSKHRDEMKKNKFEPFKDTDLMKDPALKVVFGGATKLLNGMIMGGFNLAVLVRNLYQSKQGKLTEQDIDFLQKSMRMHKLSSDGYKNTADATEVLHVAEERLRNADAELARIDQELTNQQALYADQIAERDRLNELLNNDVHTKKAEELQSTLVDADEHDKYNTWAAELDAEIARIENNQAAYRGTYGGQKTELETQKQSLMDEQQVQQDEYNQLQENLKQQTDVLNRFRESLETATAEQRPDILADINRLTNDINNINNQLGVKQGQLNRIERDIGNKDSELKRLEYNLDIKLMESMTFAKRKKFMDKDPSSKSDERAALMEQMYERQGVREYADWVSMKELIARRDYARVQTANYPEMDAEGRAQTNHELSLIYNDRIGSEERIRQLNTELVNYDNLRTQRETFEAKKFAAESERDNAQQYLNVNPYKTATQGLEKDVDGKHFKIPLQTENQKFNIRKLSMFYNIARGLDGDARRFGIKTNNHSLLKKRGYGAINADLTTQYMEQKLYGGNGIHNL